jgi:hypothetical protein
LDQIHPLKSSRDERTPKLKPVVLKKKSPKGNSKNEENNSSRGSLSN